MIVNICTLILVAVGTLICSVSLCLMTHCHTDFPQCTTRLIHTCVMIRIHSKYNPRQKSLEQNPSPPIQCCFFKTSRFAEKRPTLNGGGVVFSTNNAYRTTTWHKFHVLFQHFWRGLYNCLYKLMGRHQVDSKNSLLSLER